MVGFQNRNVVVAKVAADVASHLGPHAPGSATWMHAQDWHNDYCPNYCLHAKQRARPRAGLPWSSPPEDWTRKLLLLLLLVAAAVSSSSADGDRRDDGLGLSILSDF